MKRWNRLPCWSSKPSLRSLIGTACGLLFATHGGAVLAQVVLTTSVQKVEEVAGASQIVTLGEDEGVLPGETLRYTIVFSNQSTQDAAEGSIVITNPLPDGAAYLEGTAAGEGTQITFSTDGEHFDVPGALIVMEGGVQRPAATADYHSIRWTFEPRLPAGQSGEVSFDLLISR